MAAAYPRWATCARRPCGQVSVCRIGFVSGCFGRRHSVRRRIPMRGWVENLDRDRLQLFGCDSVRLRRSDRPSAGAVRSIERGQRQLSAWAATIERDAPHVLVYPEIGADHTTLQLAALRLAPVQCTSLGQPVTSGLPTIDYFLSSDLMEPPAAQEHYTERLVRLQSLGTAYRPEWAAWGDALPSLDPWADLDLPPGTVRFLCCRTWQSVPPRLRRCSSSHRAGAPRSTVPVRRDENPPDNRATPPPSLEISNAAGASGLRENRCATANSP